MCAGIAPHYAPTAVRKLVYESISIIKLGDGALHSALRSVYLTAVGRRKVVVRRGAQVRV